MVFNIQKLLYQYVTFFCRLFKSNVIISIFTCLLLKPLPLSVLYIFPAINKPKIIYSIYYYWWQLYFGMIHWLVVTNFVSKPFPFFYSWKVAKRKFNSSMLFSLLSYYFRPIILIYAYCTKYVNRDNKCNAHHQYLFGEF